MPATVLPFPRRRLQRLRSLPIALWLRTARERRQLASLDDRMLRDIGLTRARAEGEAARPFWDLRP